jgi:hypothetical protein
MLASTMQFSSNGRTHQAHHEHHYQHAGGYTHDPMTRVLQKHSTRTPPPPTTTRTRRNERPPDSDQIPWPVASGPNSVLGKPPPHDRPRSSPHPPKGDTGVLAATP